tara:strand:+ start:839 stop:988 length:150 start_codon:yes stop_codon:yes gene_type:complete
MNNILLNKTNEKNTKENEELKKEEEINGPKGVEPTRFGDWEKNGRCTDF